jgi:hypothetical protein
VYRYWFGFEYSQGVAHYRSKEYCIRVVSIYVYICLYNRCKASRCVWVLFMLFIFRHSVGLFYWSEMQVSLGKVFMGLVTIGYVLFFSIS